MLFHVFQNDRKFLQGNFRAQQVQKFNKAAHVSALVVVGQIYKHIDQSNGVLKTVPPVSNGDGIAKIFDPHFIDGDIAEIGLTLDILHDFNRYSSLT